METQADSSVQLPHRESKPLGRAWMLMATLAPLLAAIASALKVWGGLTKPRRLADAIAASEEGKRQGIRADDPILLEIISNCFTDEIVSSVVIFVLCTLTFGIGLRRLGWPGKAIR